MWEPRAVITYSFHPAWSTFERLSGGSAAAKTLNARVRCVYGKGAPGAGPRFDTSVADVVKDNETGLMWEKAPPNADYDQSQAKAYCETLTTGTFTDWRLPSLRELTTLIDPTIWSPALPSPSFSIPGKWYWSDTPLYGAPTSFLAVDFATGFSQNETTASPYTSPRMRCVR